MSDGARVAIYTDNTTMRYQVRLSGAPQWSGTPSTLALARESAWTQVGNTLYGVAPRSDNCFSCTVMIFFKLVYSGSATLTVTKVTDGGGGGSGTAGVAGGIYYDATNNLIHALNYRTGCCGFDLRLRALNPTTMAEVYTATPINVWASGCCANSGSMLTSSGLAGSGGSTFFYAGTSGTSLGVVRVTAGPTSYSQVQESGMPTLDASATAGALAWDGSELLYVVNEANAKLRLFRRHSAVSYSLSDLGALALGNGTQPAISRRLSNNDLLVFYQTVSAQTNGEISYISRTAGIWNPPTTLVGGDASGWSHVSASASDLNATGIGRVLYVTGTASPYAIAEDALTMPSAPAATTITGRTTISGTGLGGVLVSAYAGGGSCCRLVNETTTDSSGYYALSVPTGSSVRIRFEPRLTSQYSVGGAWNGGVETYAAAADVAAGSTSVDISLPSAAPITTSTYADPPAADRSTHLFTISDGARIAIYTDNTTLRYKVMLPGSNWDAAPTTLALARESAWTQVDDTLYGVASRSDNCFSCTVMIVFKLVYSGTTTLAVTTVTDGGGGGAGTGGVAGGIYYDATNNLIHTLNYRTGCCGFDLPLRAYNPATLAVAYSATLINVWGAGCCANSGSMLTSSGLTGPGGSTFFYAGTSGTGLGVVRVTAGSSSYTQVQESGIPALDASATAGALAWDGSELLYVVNEANAKLRLFRRHSAVSYSLSDMATIALGPATQPAIARRLSTNDLAVFFQTNAGQANGEVGYITRAGGIWSEPATLVGGDTSGWSHASVAAKDTNASGIARLLYVRGTASPYTLVEDSFAQPSAPVTASVTGRATISGTGLSGVVVTGYAGGGACCRLMTQTTTDSSGYYALSVPTGSTVRIRFDPRLTSHYSVGGAWNGGAATYSAAADVPAGASGVNVSLPSFVTLATSSSTDPHANDRSAHFFTMPDGARLALYTDGTSLRYRVMLPNSTWNAVPISFALARASAWTQVGNTLYGWAGRSDPCFSCSKMIVFKLVYSGTTTLAVTTNIDGGGGGTNNGGVAGGIYYDATNNLIHTLNYVSDCCGWAIRLHAWSPSNLAAVYNANAINVFGAACCQASGSMPTGSGLVGSGGSTFFYAGSSGLILGIVRVVAGASSYTQTQESGISPLAASATAGALVWDGSELLYIANEADAKLRAVSRTGIDSYSGWTDVVTTRLGAATQPAAHRQLTSGDLTVFYRSDAAQANGEIHYVRRVGGSWGSPTVLAGGGSSGWAHPSASADDANAGGAVRVVYRMGTSAPFAIVEDSIAPPPGTQVADAASVDDYSFGYDPNAAIGADPVNLGTGVFTTQAEDLAIPGRVLSLAFRRWYNSADTTAGALGPGWTHSYEWTVTDLGDSVRIRRGDGRVDVYTRNTDGSYSNPPNSFDFLVKSVDGTFTLTAVNQVIYEFSPAGQLTTISEPAGNQVTFAYTDGLLSSITDTVGRVVTFEYDPLERLIDLRDPLDRRVIYGYDADGRLISVADRLATAEAAYREEVLADSPRSYWMLDETSGTLAADVGSAQHSGAYTSVSLGLSGATGDAGNRAAAFDGQSSGIGFGDVHNFVGTSAFSVEAWIMPTNLDQTERVIIDRRVEDASGVQGWAISVESSRGVVASRWRDGARDEVSYPNIRVDEWYHVVATYDGATLRLYVDGDERDSVGSALALLATSTPLRVGLPSAGVGAAFAGLIDELAAFDAALSLSRISAHYSAVAPRWRYGYAGSGRHIAAIADPEGRVRVRNTYDLVGRVVEQRDGLGELTVMTYGESQTVVTDPRGHQTIYTFDDRKRVLTQSETVGGIPYSISYTYDAQGNRTSVTDRRGYTTDFTHDARGNVLTKLDPPPTPGAPRPLTQLSYDPRNNLIETIDAEGFATTLTYDPITNLLLGATRQIDALTSATTTYEYEDLANPGLPTAIISPRGFGPSPDYTYATFLAYDAEGNLVSSVDPDGAMTTYAYDAVGRMTMFVDPDGNDVGAVPAQHTWTLEYDAVDREIRRTDPLGSVVSYEYDRSGNRIALTDRRGNVTFYEYDPNARLIRVVQRPDPLGDPQLAYVTEIARDPNGNATRTTQANGVSTDYTFDGLNRLVTATTRPDASTALLTTYVLDGNGSPITRTTGDGVTVSYTYDALSRLTSIGAPGGFSIAYEYSRVGRRTQMVDSTGMTSYVYDGLGRLTSVAAPSGTLTYSYDPDGNRTVLGYPGADQVTYTYSSGGRLLQVEDWAGRVTHYQYRPSGLVAELTNATGLTSTYVYDRAQRLTRITNAVGEELITDHAYMLDEEGNRVELDEFVQGITPLALSWSASAQVNDDTGTTVQDRPAVALGADGATHLVWDDTRTGNSDVRFSRRDPSTGAWSANVKVNDDTGTRSQLAPAVAVDADGNAYAVWRDERNGSNNNPDADIFASKRSTSTGAWSPNVRVNDDSGPARVQRDPRIAVAASGAATAVWVDLRSNQKNIYSSALAAGGSAWAANKRVTDNTAADKDSPDVAIGPDGTAHAVWQDHRSGNADVYYAALAPGASAWSASIKVSDDPGAAAQRTPRVAVDGAGNLTVVWLDERTSPAQVRSSRRAAGSSTWAASEILSDAAAVPASPAIAARADGLMTVVWSDGRSGPTAIYAAHDGGDGVWSLPAPVGDVQGSELRPTIARSGADVAVAWRDDRSGNADVRARGAMYVAGGPEHFGYSYDGLNRLTSVAGPVPETFELDPATNISSRTGPSGTYSYDQANRLTSDGSASFIWSGADRLIQRGADTFEYDALGRMISSTASGATHAFTYDGSGLMTSTVEDTTSTTLVWDPGSAPPSLLQVGPDRVVYGLAALYLAQADGTVRSLARDGLGSIRAEVTDAGGVATFRYNVQGSVRQDSAGPPTLLGFAGELLGPHGLIYLRARWYDPDTGRFITTDPVAGSAELPVSLNLFSYAAGNPVNLTDPSGTCTDPSPGSGEPRYCVAAFIPTAVSCAPLIGTCYRGDDRGASGTSGTSRLELHIRPDGSATAIPGHSLRLSDGAEAAATASCRSVSAVGSYSCSSPNPLEPLSLLAPIRFWVIVGQDRVSVTHSKYPSLEIWRYDAGGRRLLYHADANRHSTAHLFVSTWWTSVANIPAAK